MSCALLEVCILKGSVFANRGTYVSWNNISVIEESCNMIDLPSLLFCILHNEIIQYLLS